jgi:hypothetical protein
LPLNDPTPPFRFAWNEKREAVKKINSDSTPVPFSSLAEIKGLGKQLIFSLQEKLNQRLHSKSG